MPNIIPISDLRNYSSVLDNVAVGSPVYLTKNGRGCYAIIDISEQEEYEKTRAALHLMCELEKGKRSGEEQGWIDSSDVRKHFSGQRFNRNTIWTDGIAWSPLMHIVLFAFIRHVSTGIHTRMR